MSQNIDKALIQSFIDGAFGLSIAHDNVAFEPTSQEAYAEIRVLPSKIEANTYKDLNQTSGIFRVILRHPLLKGSVGAKAKAEEIMAHYKIGSAVSFGGQSVRIKSVQRQPGFHEEGWYKTVIDIHYYAFIAR